MNRHLSSEEFAERLVSEQSAEIENHLRNCPECSAELAWMQSSLAGLRTAVHRWTDAQLGSDLQTIRRVKRAPYRAFVARVSFAMALVIACVCLRLSLQSTVPADNAAQARTTMTDAEILATVDQQLTSTVPTSMAPLTRPAFWTSGESQRHASVSRNY